MSSGHNVTRVLCQVLQLLLVGSLLALLGVGEHNQLALVCLQTLYVQVESSLALVCSAFVDSNTDGLGLSRVDSSSLFPFISLHSTFILMFLFVRPSFSQKIMLNHHRNYGYKNKKDRKAQHKKDLKKSQEKKYLELLEGETTTKLDLEVVSESRGTNNRANSTGGRSGEDGSGLGKTSLSADLLLSGLVEPGLHSKLPLFLEVVLGDFIVSLRHLVLVSLFPQSISIYHHINMIMSREIMRFRMSIDECVKWVEGCVKMYGRLPPRMDFG